MYTMMSDDTNPDAPTGDRHRLPMSIIRTIATDKLARFYLGEDFLFETLPGQVFDAEKYLETLRDKVIRENPGQIFCHPAEFRHLRTSAGELGLLILHGMKTYKDVSSMTTRHFVCDSTAAMTYLPECRVVAEVIETIVLDREDNEEKQSRHLTWRLPKEGICSQSVANMLW